MNMKEQVPQGTAESQAGKGLSEIERIAKYVQNFADFGLISNEQKDFLYKNIDAVMEKLNAQNVATQAMPEGQNPDVIDFEHLSDEENNFFESRQSLMKYLTEAGVALSREEFEKIFVLVNELEKQAIQKFLLTNSEGGAEIKGGENSQNGQDILKQANEVAKQKLQTASAVAFGGPVDVVKKFSPEQIGKMSSAEFIANEHLINDQIRRGDFVKRH